MNWATILLACAGISDSFFRWIVGGPWPEWGIDAAVRRVDEASLAEATGTPADTLTSPLWWVLLIVAFVVWQCVLNVPAFPQPLLVARLMNAHFNRWGLGNAYGAFGSMSEVRHEIAIEGTLDPSGTDGWREYVFKGKPGDVDRRGPVVAPYHLRLDWLMWFAALGDYRDSWFLALVERLGTGDPLIRRRSAPTPSTARHRRSSARGCSPTATPPGTNAARRRRPVSPCRGGCAPTRGLSSARSTSAGAEPVETASAPRRDRHSAPRPPLRIETAT